MALTSSQRCYRPLRGHKNATSVTTFNVTKHAVDSLNAMLLLGTWKQN